MRNNKGNSTLTTDSLFSKIVLQTTSLTPKFPDFSLHILSKFQEATRMVLNPFLSCLKNNKNFNPKKKHLKFKQQTYSPLQQ